MALLIGVVISGCGSTEGTSVSCPLEDGTACKSLDSVYRATVGKPLVEEAVGEESALRRVRYVAGPSQPRVLPPKFMRVWLAPWVDEDGDLHDHQYLYILLDGASWDVEALRQPAP